MTPRVTSCSERIRDGLALDHIELERAAEGSLEHGTADPTVALEGMTRLRSRAGRPAVRGACLLPNADWLARLMREALDNPRGPRSPSASCRLCGMLTTRYTWPCDLAGASLRR